MVQLCLDSREYISEQHRQAIPLRVESGGEHQCVGVLYLERREGTEQETDRLLFELVARYVAIVLSLIHIWWGTLATVAEIAGIVY